MIDIVSLERSNSHLTGAGEYSIPVTPSRDAWQALFGNPVVALIWNDLIIPIITIPFFSSRKHVAALLEPQEEKRQEVAVEQVEEGDTDKM